MGWTRFIAEIKKVLISPFKLLDGAGEISDNVSVGSETFDDSRGEFNTLLGTHGGNEFIDNLNTNRNASG